MSGTQIQAKALKAIIFDYGEVLCFPPTRVELEQLASFFSITVERLPALWEKNRGPYDRGDLTAQSYWSMLASDAGADLLPEQLNEICQLDMDMWSHINGGMVRWAHQLRSSGMKIGLLSNMHPDMVTHVRKQFSWLDQFDHVTFSAEARLIKPDRAIYERTLKGLGVKADETLFLDDREVNIRAARALGIHSIHVQSTSQLQNDLKAAGFTILPENS